MVTNARKLLRQQRRNGELAVNFSGGGSRSNNSEGSSSFDAAREAAEAELEECDSDPTIESNKEETAAVIGGRSNIMQQQQVSQIIADENA